MRPKERCDSGQNDLFRARLDQIVDMAHPLAKLAAAIDWGFLEQRFGAVYSDGSGQPPLPTRLMAGLAIFEAHARDQRQNQRGKKVYSLHAPEVECIGKGKAHRPYEFGVKVSVATTLHRSKGGQFIVHAKALPGAPYDGHTLGVVIPEMEQMIGAPMQRILADRGYRGHNAPPERKFRVFIAGQKRRMTKAIKREMRRRSAVEPVIGHAKTDHRMARNFLAHAIGDAANAVLAAAGYNFRRLLAWLTILRAFIIALISAYSARLSAA